MLLSPCAVGVVVVKGTRKFWTSVVDWTGKVSLATAASGEAKGAAIGRRRGGAHKDHRRLLESSSCEGDMARG